MAEPKQSVMQVGIPRRRPLSPPTGGATQVSPLAGAAGAVVLEPAEKGADLAAGTLDRDAVNGLLSAHGAVLCRGFAPLAAEDLERFIRTVSDAPLEYRERSSPRRPVAGRIYTSTEYPADQPILFHNENSYAHQWPLKLFFLCVQPAESGGATPLADCRQVLRSIAPALRQRFEERGVMYVRNFGTGLGLEWQEVFQTTDRTELERTCRAHGYELEWIGDSRLRTRRVAPAVVRHPRTGEDVWFNHAAFFHSSSLPAGVRDTLLREFDEADLPNATFYGDGSPIDPEAIAEIRRAYETSRVRFEWQRGDLLIVDNMLFAHGREPFTGGRRIVVGMSEPQQREEAGGPGPART